MLCKRMDCKLGGGERSKVEKKLTFHLPSTVAVWHRQNIPVVGVVKKFYSPFLVVMPPSGSQMTTLCRWWWFLNYALYCSVFACRGKCQMLSLFGIGERALVIWHLPISTISGYICSNFEHPKNILKSEIGGKSMVIDSGMYAQKVPPFKLPVLWMRYDYCHIHILVHFSTNGSHTIWGGVWWQTWDPCPKASSRMMLGSVGKAPAYTFQMLGKTFPSRY